MMEDERSHPDLLQLLLVINKTGLIRKEVKFWENEKKCMDLKLKILNEK